MSLIICVDDSEIALASEKIIIDMIPIEVKQYLSATVALADIKGGMTPNLIITDMYMPLMDGFEFLKEVRSHHSTARTPILMLTTNISDEAKAKGRALGLTGWVVKPFTPAQLKQAIERVLRLA